MVLSHAFKYSTSSLVLLTFVGCAGLTGLRMQKPVAETVVLSEVDIPSLWKSAGEGNNGQIASGWLKSIKDPEMSAMVNEALEHNQNLKVAAARLRAAKEGTIIGRARRLPSVDFSGSGSRTRTGNGPDDSPDRSTSYGLSLNASWEIDLWGRLRDLDLASYEDFLAASADFRGARLSLAANTAKAWCNLITARQQATLALETRNSYVRNFRITERNFKAGDVSASALDVQFGRNNIASAERELIDRELSRDEAKRSLEVLLGRYPAAALEGRDQLPELPKDVPVGLPSELLLRRPDLVAAAADLRASAKRADAARKDLLPSIRLSGRGSSSSEELGKMLVDPEYIVWNVASSLAQTVYGGGAPTAEARQSLAQNEIAIRTFAEIALQAFREVESGLAIERSLASQEEFLATELQQANLAEVQASRDYSEGIVGILEILEAQRRAVNARRSMISLRNQRLQNRIDLHLALGGDFATPAP
ncbi:MAG: efflux transporter outer membrane subunit [Verrucomicrobia bacterium]|nr:efflux transporter outer membrane subunit [Verrucomicrobiota bacterium]